MVSLDGAGHAEIYKASPVDMVARLRRICRIFLFVYLVRPLASPNSESPSFSLLLLPTVSALSDLCGLQNLCVFLATRLFDLFALF